VSKSKIIDGLKGNKLVAAGLVILCAFVCGWLGMVGNSDLFVYEAFFGAFLGGGLYWLIQWLITRNETEYGSDPYRGDALSMGNYGGHNQPVDSVARNVQSRAIEETMHEQLRSWH